MSPLFSKLNLKSQTEILVLNTPESFQSEIDALKEVSVLQETDSIEETTFLLAFVTKQAEVDRVAMIVASQTSGDALIWLAYPKSQSKKYQCEFNRDNGWEMLGKAGLEVVRQVAIDEDWSALRFRRVEFIKTISRDRKRAISEQGKARSK
jgi:hypothetical protein